jgi:hypothetical protein
MAVTNVADIAVPAGIHQNPVEIGKVGTHLLHSLVMNNERGLPAIPKQILVDGSWVDGASLPGRGHRVETGGQTRAQGSASQSRPSRFSPS